jgi:hypothetical protein
MLFLQPHCKEPIERNCTAHSSPAIEAVYAAHTILPLPLPPHSSNQLQTLDLSIFRITKRHILRMNKMENLNVQSKHIAQVVCSFMSAATPVNVIQMFRNAGIVLAVEEVGLKLKEKCIHRKNNVSTKVSQFFWMDSHAKILPSS